MLYLRSVANMTPRMHEGQLESRKFRTRQRPHNSYCVHSHCPFSESVLAYAAALRPPKIPKSSKDLFFLSITLCAYPDAPSMSVHRRPSEVGKPLCVVIDNPRHQSALFPRVRDELVGAQTPDLDKLEDCGRPSSTYDLVRLVVCLEGDALHT